MVRLGTLSDIDMIMEIIKDAKKLLKDSGSTQWNEPDGYPTRDTFISDINNNVLYVSVRDNIVVGLCAVVPGLDPSYSEIDGAWLQDNKYSAIHRMAVKKEYYHKGITLELLDNATEVATLNGSYSLRADTHKLNKPMQGLLNKYGFKLCGEIHLVNNKYDNLRLAYEKIIK